ncbi:helix-turn-helix domain-containing protein [Yinghuangia soli]|uniref:Helix-turn-helix domain-containing protein n=1 Tax=Yinghuangia soli TaxID=2908204 RepID=A0AA41PY28_9ACTN|nr:helix-turn-helix transcriptional regulator [Yinghuangia soli]MCF2527868.1 helix-turn-helix domain-containing protein [Yinghuangia soli]
MGADQHTLKRQRLGRELRQVRLDQGLTLRQVAARMKMDGNKLGRMELAKAYVEPHDLHRLCDIYDVTPDQRHAWELLLVGKRPQHWWRSYADIMSAAYTEFVALENDAVEAIEYAPMVMSGLLQTSEYATMLLSTGARALGLEQAEALGAVRLARQQRLSTEPSLKFHCVVNEVALGFDLGEPEVLREQLEHLARVAKQDNVTIQVLPLSAGRMALQPVPFTVLKFGDEADPDVASSEDLGGTILYESEREVRRCNRLFDQISRAALTPDDSMMLLHARLEEGNGS